MKGVSKLILILAVGLILSVQNTQAQDKVSPTKPTLPFQEGVWKIVNFWTEPKCYTIAKDKDTKVKINAIFECTKEGAKPPKVDCKDLNLKFSWKSNIEQIEKTINLTEKIKSSCGPGATSCRIDFNGETMEVKLMPKQNRISISKTGNISPKVIGNIELAIEVFTGATLSDKRRITLPPCVVIPGSPVSKGYDATVDFSPAGPDHIKITIKDLDKARAATIQAYVKITHPPFSGNLNLNEDTTNFGVFSVVYPFTWTQGVSCTVIYTDELTSSGDRNVQRTWRYVVP
ncbi:MAG: hypothetical protein ABDH16_04850 [Thermodesulfovibrionaceae bacterium]